MLIFTIGYERHELGEFTAILLEHKIAVLADIRINPNSRKKGFSKKQLAAELAKNGIEYIHIRELGTPQDIRERVRDDQDYVRFFRDYETYLAGQGDALHALAKLASGRNICLMCYERDVNQCHRRAVAENLRKRFGIETAHL
jgi:uncharacterized protein (DUF488 family)